MRRSSWYALMIVAAVGWGIAGLLAFALVSRVGWFGILIIGLIIILVPQLAELDARNWRRARPRTRSARRKATARRRAPSPAESRCARRFRRICRASGW